MKITATKCVYADVVAILIIMTFIRRAAIWRILKQYIISGVSLMGSLTDVLSLRMSEM